VRFRKCIIPGIALIETALTGKSLYYVIIRLLQEYNFRMAMGFRYGNFFIPMPLQWLKKPPKISLWEEKSCLSRPYSPFRNSIFPLYAFVASCAKLSKNLERYLTISKRKCTHPITYVGARTQVQSGCTRPFWQGVPCKTSPRWSVVNWNLEMYLLQVVARTMLPKRNRLPVTCLRNRGQFWRFFMILSDPLVI
jgi:hypothetical protein